MSTFLTPETIQTEIARMLRLPQSEWIAEAKNLQSETLVFLIRQTRFSDQKLAGGLVQVLRKRTARLARRQAQGLGCLAAMDILPKVEREILKLVLAKKPSRYTDMLGIAFARAVEMHTRNAIRKDHLGPIAADATYEDAGYRPGPEDILLNLQEDNPWHQLLRKACDAVRDQRHLEAAILHFAHEWPITSEDPNEADLARHFQVTPRQIRRWIAMALEQMRAAVGAVCDRPVFR